MTTLTETYHDVGLTTASGRVVVTAAQERESAGGGSRIIPKEVARTFSGGSFELELEPGLAEVWVYITDGPTLGKRVTIPATGPVRLKDLTPEVLDLKTVTLFTEDQLDTWVANHLTQGDPGDKGAQVVSSTVVAGRIAYTLSDGTTADGGLAPVAALAFADDGTPYPVGSPGKLLATVDAAVSRVKRPSHAPALGLFFPEAEGATIGSSNNTAAIQAAVDACPAGARVVFPLGNLIHTSPISITKAVKLVGLGSGKYMTRMMADGCNGIEVAAGVAGFEMSGIELATKVRYTTTANAQIGVKVSGTAASQATNHIYRDVYIDGFWTAFQSRYLWSSVLDNFGCNNGLIGIDAYGLSVNNFVCGGSRISVAQVAGSRGIRFSGYDSPGGAAAASEGWTVTGVLIDGGEIGVEIIGYTHMNISDNIIDHCGLYGVLIRDNGTNFAGNSKIAGNYIALSGTSATAGICSANAISNTQNRGNRITDNHILAYTGAACINGISVTGAYGKATITGNVSSGMSGPDIRVNCVNNIIRSNRCLSASAPANIYTTYVNHIEGNEGTVYLNVGEPVVYAMDALGRRIFSGTQAPTVGAFSWGDEVRHARPAVGSPKSWLCTASGSPGTWVSTGNL